MTLRFTLLGCGSSAGVPRVAQGFGRCDPANPKNTRRRCSLLVERGETCVLVDTSPDLRWQLIDAGVMRLDGVLMTHDHADHTHGIDDLRPLHIQHRQRIDMFMDAPTSRGVRRKFDYIFETPPGSSYPPIVAERRVTAGQAVTISGPGGAIEALPFDLDHGEITALGYRFENVAYTPDVVHIPDASVDFLRGLDLWIVDALRYHPHPSHFCLAQTLDWIGRLKPKRAILTSLHTDMDYETLRRELPEGVEPGYDGMRVEV